MLGQVWTCSFCNHTGNQWRNVFCDSCGMPRALDVKPQNIEDTTLENNTLGLNLDNILNLSESDGNQNEISGSKPPVPDNFSSSNDEKANVVEDVFKFEELKEAASEPAPTPISDNSPTLFNIDATNIEVVQPTLNNNAAVEELFFEGNKKKQLTETAKNVTENKQLSEIEDPFNKEITLPKVNSKNVRPPVKQTTILYTSIALTAISCILITLFTVKLFTNKNNSEVQAVLNQGMQKIIRQKFMVVGHEWSRTGNIGYYQLAEHQGWDLPTDAELISSTQTSHNEKTLLRYDTKASTVRKKVGTVKVFKGRRKLPNGTYQDIYENKPAYSSKTVYKKVPIYKTTRVKKTKYVYRLKEWINVDAFTLKEQNKSPYWPKMDQNHERRETKEEYHILVKNPEAEVIKIPTKYELWKQFEVGNKVSIQQTDKGWEIIE